MKLKFACLVLFSFLFMSCNNRHKSVTNDTDKATTMSVIENNQGADSVFLLKHGLQLTQLMQQLANDSAYIAYATQAKGIKPLIASIRKQSYSHPRKVFVIRHLQTDKKDWLSQSSRTKPLIIDRLLRTIPTRLNAQSGSNVLATTSLLFAEDVFLYQGLNEYTLYLYLYEGNCHSMVLYRPAKNNIVQASASFVIHKELDNLKTATDVKQFFAKTLNMKQVEVF